MELTELTAISPDRRALPRQVRGAGRLFFRTGSDPLPCAGRGGVFHRALRVASASAGRRGSGAFEKLRDLYRDFTAADALKVKEIERTTNHDVKAVEYLVKGKLDELGLGSSPRVRALRPDVAGHQQHGDSVEPARCVERRLLSAARATDGQADRVVERMGGVPLLAHTHGRRPRRRSLGKEIRVFVERIEKQTALLRAIPSPAKFGGATATSMRMCARIPMSTGSGSRTISSTTCWDSTARRPRRRSSITTTSPLFSITSSASIRS